MPPRITVTTPAKAGAQLGNAALSHAALRYQNLANWAPASAGVVQMAVHVAGMAAREAHA